MTARMRHGISDPLSRLGTNGLIRATVAAAGEVRSGLGRNPFSYLAFALPCWLHLQLDRKRATEFKRVALTGAMLGESR